METAGNNSKTLCMVALNAVFALCACFGANGGEVRMAKSQKADFAIRCQVDFSRVTDDERGEGKCPDGDDDHL